MKLSGEWNIRFNLRISWLVGWPNSKDGMVTIVIPSVAFPSSFVHRPFCLTRCESGDINFCVKPAEIRGRGDVERGQIAVEIGSEEDTGRSITDRSTAIAVILCRS